MLYKKKTIGVKKAKNWCKKIVTKFLKLLLQFFYIIFFVFNNK